MGMIPSTHYSLFARLKVAEQKKDAWERLHALYHETIYRWCLRHGLQPADAEDVTQVVWAHLLRALPEHEHDGTRPFRCWLKAVVVNAIRDRLRAEGRRPGGRGVGGSFQERLADLEDASSMEDLAVEIESQKDHDLAAAMNRVQARVGQSAWQAFWLLAVEELPAAEVAIRLRMTLGSVYQARYRVSSLLAQEWNGLHGQQAQT
jgi:RNA polymerase sigma-70 factor (ECF subfamily)